MNGNNKEMGGSYLVDMNGNVVHEWRNLFGMPSKVFPNGVIMGSQADIGGDPGDLTVMDFDGNVLWQLPFKAPYTDYPRQHHDYQVSGNPVGYYAPGQTPNPLGDKILIDGRAPLDNPKVSPKTLQDEFIYEVDVKTKKIVWSWNASSSFDQLGLSDSAKEVISAAGGNWIHINSVSYVGPNKWWDEDPIKYSMFNPENIIWDSRHNNILGITDRKGDIVWRVGPDYAATPELKMLGQIVGQHHAHMIPKGLPAKVIFLFSITVETAVSETRGQHATSHALSNSTRSPWKLSGNTHTAVKFFPVKILSIAPISPPPSVCPTVIR